MSERSRTTTPLLVGILVLLYLVLVMMFVIHRDLNNIDVDLQNIYSNQGPQ